MQSKKQFTSGRNFMKMRLLGIAHTIKHPSFLFSEEKEELNKALVHIESVLKDWNKSNRNNGIGTRASHNMSKKKKQAISNIVQMLCQQK